MLLNVKKIFIPLNFKINKTNFQTITFLKVEFIFGAFVCHMSCRRILLKIPNRDFKGVEVLEGGGTYDVPNLAAAKGSPLAKLLFRFS